MKVTVWPVNSEMAPGLIARAPAPAPPSVITMFAVLVAVEASTTRIVAAPATPGAVYCPVPFILPAPDAISNVYGGKPPVATNRKLSFTDTETETGDIFNDWSDTLFRASIKLNGFVHEFKKSRVISNADMETRV